MPIVGLPPAPTAVRYVALAAVFALAGCGLLEPSATEPGVVDVPDIGLVLTTESRMYEAGSAVALTLRNESRQRYEMGVFCLGSLERERDGRWYRVDPPEGYACILPLITVEPGGRYEDSFYLYDGLSPGTYRLVHRVYETIGEGDGLPVVSNAFTVRR